MGDGCIGFSVDIVSIEECRLAADFLSVRFNDNYDDQNSKCIQTGDGGEKVCTCVYRQNGIDPWIWINEGSDTDARVCKLQCEGIVDPTFKGTSTTATTTRTTTATTTTTTTTDTKTRTTSATTTTTSASTTA